MKESSRDHLFDNIKAIMLILVIIGHTIDPFIYSEDGIFRIIMQYIYLFHMPMFAFVTGYFSKNAEKARDGAVKKIFIPYLLIQTVYILVALFCIKTGLASFNADVFKPSIILPTSPLYYLLCVFMWKTFQKDFMKLRYPVLISIIIGVCISLTSNDSMHIGIGATFSLLIFFVLGVKCTPEHVQKIRSTPKWIAIVILGLAIIPAIILPYNFRNVRYSYASVGLEPVTGILYRLLFYAIAICMIIALIRLFSQKHTILSVIGERSILVYAGSSFAAPSLYLIITSYLPLGNETILNFVGIVLFAFIIAFFFSMSWINTLYNKILNSIYKILFK